MIGEIKNRNSVPGGIEMESYHWFFLGMMVALTPSLLVLGVLLARSMGKADEGRAAQEMERWVK